MSRGRTSIAIGLRLVALPAASLTGVGAGLAGEAAGFAAGSSVRSTMATPDLVASALGSAAGFLRAAAPKKERMSPGIARLRQSLLASRDAGVGDVRRLREYNGPLRCVAQIRSRSGV